MIIMKLCFTLNLDPESTVVYYTIQCQNHQLSSKYYFDMRSQHSSKPDEPKQQIYCYESIMKFIGLCARKHK